MLDPYFNLLIISDADPRLLDKLSTDPVEFDCDSFEADQTRLYKQLENKKAKMQRRLLFYPGPFKLLILSDGTIMRRGQITTVPQEDFEDLKRIDRCFTIEDDSNKHFLCYQDIYRQQGSAALLEGFSIKKIINIQESDFSVLKYTDHNFKEKLVGIIKHKKRYIVLTGSDPKNELGCCPSEEVGMANELVEAGLLSSWSQDLPADACPTTIYAFKNEISELEADPEFSINHEFREMFLSHANLRPGLSPLKQLLKYVLIVFIVASLFVAFKESSSSVPGDKTIYEVLQKPADNEIVLLLFHQQKRCELCLNMEHYSKELLTEQYPNVRFRMIDLDDPANKAFAENYLVSLHIMTFKQSKLDKQLILEGPYRHYQDKEAFKNALELDLNSFIGTVKNE